MRRRRGAEPGRLAADDEQVDRLRSVELELEPDAQRPGAYPTVSREWT